MFARFVTGGLLAVALITASSERAQATEKLRAELTVIADQVSKALKGMEQTTVSMGNFKGPTTLPSSTGPLFTNLLKEELEKKQVSVKNGEKYAIHGEYMDVIDASTSKLAVQIKGELIETKSSTPIVTFNRGAPSESATTLATLFGITAELPTKATATETLDQKVDQALQAGLDSPKVAIRESIVSASPTSLYAIELLVRTPQGYVPRPAVEDDGLAFCKIAKSEIYGIRLHNKSPYDAAVKLSIDGLSVFAFSENKNYTHFVLPPNSKSDVLGWHRSNLKSDSFLVVSYGESEVAKLLPNSAGVGTITAVFSAAWERGKNPPPDEPPLGKGGTPPDATGRGPSIDVRYSEVLRDVGVPRSTVSIRYTKPDPTDLPPGEAK
jgi:hypothetical protein